MDRRGSAKVRMTVELVLFCIFGFVVPPLMAPLGSSWGKLLVSFGSLLLAVVFLYDFLRTVQRLKASESGR
jgi:hypothetical protein